MAGVEEDLPYPLTPTRSPRLPHRTATPIGPATLTPRAFERMFSTEVRYECETRPSPVSTQAYNLGLLCVDGVLHFPVGGGNPPLQNDY